MKHDNNRKPRHLIPFLLAIPLVLAAVVYMKKAVDTPPTPAADQDPRTEAPVAIPDTSTPASLPVAPETISIVRPDTTVRDSRPPYEAGYEDGYLNGMDDGGDNSPRATYDETSLFPSAGERAAYVEGYREGYARGFDDGLHKRQFNITPPRK